MITYDSKHVYQTGETNEYLRAKYNPEGSQMRIIQCRMLEMLNYVVDACDALGIDYYLVYGTLLGAVRHGGFIPWDDDLDIAVDSRDIRRLQKYLMTHLDSSRYVLQNRITDKGYYYGWIKIRDKLSSSAYYGPYYDVKNQYKVMQYTGVFIDIFPYSDHVIPWINKILHGFHKRVTMSYFVGRSEFIANFLYGLMFYVLKPIANILGLFFSNRKTIAHDYCSCNTVHQLEKDKIYPLSTIEFEGREYKAPKDVDYYLTTTYGNWMSLPPEEARHHHYVIFQLKKEACSDTGLTNS